VQWLLHPALNKFDFLLDILNNADIMKITDDKLRNLSKNVYGIGKLSFGALVLGWMG